MLPRFAPLRPASLTGTLTRAAANVAACASLALPGAAAPAAPALGVALPGHVPPLAAGSALEGLVLGSQTMQLAVALPVRDQKGLDDALYALYDGASPAYHQYLTPAQFADRFSPTQAQYDAVGAYLQSKGLTVTGTHSGRLLLDVQGDAATVQSAFGVHLGRYLSPSGREFFAPDADPTVDPAMAGLISGVIGLDNVVVARPAIRPSRLAGKAGGAVKNLGSDPHGTGLTPGDIKTAYNLNSVQANGSGQSVALFEADGFYPSDVSTYETAFRLPNIPLTVKAVGFAAGSAPPPNTSQAPVNYVGQEEATADIEMVAALAPNLTQIYVYEVPATSPNAPQTDTTHFAQAYMQIADDNLAQAYMQIADDNLAQAYMQIADDNLAHQVSTSWYAGVSGETGAGTALINSENTAFQKMAMQGQSMFTTSGDFGPYANNSSFSVQDPASQPWVCSVGGTTLTINTTGNNIGGYASETTWGGVFPVHNNDGGSGGGVSAIWPIPAWQAQPAVAGTAANSSGPAYTFNPTNAFNYRNLPDVALNADFNNTPYSTYISPIGQPARWYGNGGTSLAAPLWASFTALANQLRAAGSTGPIGTVSTTDPVGGIDPLLYRLGTAQYLYEIGQSSLAVSDFHDITYGGNNTNGHPNQNAVTGYDDATGWGSFNGANLMADLVHPPTYAVAPLPQPIYRSSHTSAPSPVVPYYGTYYGTGMGETYGLLAEGWSYVGVIGFAFTLPGDYPNPNNDPNRSLLPLYKLHRTNGYEDNFFTTSLSEANAAVNSGNYLYDTTQCYVFPVPSDQSHQVLGTVPVYRGYDAYGHHVFTASQAESQAWMGGSKYNPLYPSNWTLEEIAFYILAH